MTVVDLPLLHGANEGDWREQALCAQTNPEEFFAEKGGTTKAAKQICGGCEVRPQCLSYALEADERYGVWGGLSERDAAAQGAVSACSSGMRLDMHRR